MYARDKQIRILNVHQAQQTEGVVRSSLIAPQLLGIECNDTEFDLCHVQDGLLTILYYGETATGWRSWIVVIDVEYYDIESGRLALVAGLWTREDIIVRNNARYLCALSPTGTSPTGRHREWVAKVWDLGQRNSRPLSLQIPDLAVGELGHDLVFEIYDTHLYVVSTQSPCDIEEPEWTAHYSCFRFPLENPHAMTLENIQIWRRHHQEGPINDLWTSLSLHQDESTGELIIVEARKEWTGASSSQRRIWYRQPLPTQFSTSEDITQDDDGEMTDSDGEEDDSDQVLAAAQLQNLAFASHSMQDPPYLFAIPPNGDASHGDFLPDPRAINQQPIHSRLPCNTHREYPADAPIPDHLDSSTLAKSRYRAYNPSASAFLDLVADDRHPACRNQGTQQVRVRIGARVEASPVDHEGMIHKHLVNPVTGQPVEGSELRYNDLGIRSWPPLDAPTALQDLLNGSSVLDDPSERESRRRDIGEILAVSDERSIIYLIRKKRTSGDDWGQLILINFDQTVRFQYERWTPRVLDLYHHNDSTDIPLTIEQAEQIAIEDILDREYALPVAMDVDPPDDNEEHEEHDAADESDEGLSIMPADEINQLFWCEEYDEDEPVNMQWFMTHMALWTEIREGFSFK